LVGVRPNVRSAAVLGRSRRGGRRAIQRLVYNYPFSKGGDLYDYLLRTMAEYRAVMGQPNQEELLGLLRKRIGEDPTAFGNLEKLFLNLCPYCHRNIEKSNGQGE
jgi:hypothetical protein